jgi:hypothetical protein
MVMIDTPSLGPWTGMCAAINRRLKGLDSLFHVKEEKMFPDLAGKDSIHRDSILKAIIHILKTPRYNDSTMELYELERQILLLKAVIKNLDRLEKSSQLYGIRYIEDEDKSGTRYDFRHRKIVFSIPPGSVANFVHETTHGGQFEDGEIVYDKSPAANFSPTTEEDTLLLGIGNDFGDEIDAYKAQFAFDPHSVSGLNDSLKIYGLDDINAAWLVRLTADGKYPYALGGSAKLALIHVTVWSDLETLKKAYPWYPWDIKKRQWHGRYPLKSKKYLHRNPRRNRFAVLD